MAAPSRTSATISLSALAFLTAASATAGDLETSKEIRLDGKTAVHSVELAGSVAKTLYRYEDYTTTCSRDVDETHYRYACDTRNIHHCSRETGQCRTEQEQYNCGDRPYTVTRTETYACTQTRAIKIGTEHVEDVYGRITVRFSGDTRGVTGKDAFLLTIGNGLDVAGEVRFALKHSEDTHLLKLKKQEYKKESAGEKKSIVTALYEIEVMPVDDVASLKTNVIDLHADRGGLALDLTGAKLDETVEVYVTAKKDRRLGGLVDAGYDKLLGSEMTVEDINGGYRAFLPFGMCFKPRPYEFEVTLTRTAPPTMIDGLLNPAAFEKVKGSLVTKYRKRVRLSGGKAKQCEVRSSRPKAPRDEDGDAVYGVQRG